MRILLLSPHPGVHGPLPKHTPLLVDALREKGCEVTSEPWGRHSDTETLPAKIFGRARDIGRIRSLVTATPFDVMVVKTSLEWMSLLRDVPLLLVVRRRVPKTVIQFHGGNPDRLRAPGNLLFKQVSQMLFRLSDGVFVLSSEEARAAAAFYPHGTFEVVINPFLPPDDGCAPPTSKSAAVPTLLYASRLVKEKGIFDTLDAFALVRARRPCRLVIAGTGAAAGEVAARVDALELADAVVIAGQLSHDELTAAYRGADIFVLPTYWGEGFPTAIAEAMSAGLPVVTTASRGMADHLCAGVNALFVPPREPATLADTLGRLLDDDELRLRIGGENRTKVRDFAPEVAAEIYLRALAQIDAGPPAKTPR